MSETHLLWGLLFGGIGIGYIIYGRRQQHVVAFVAGLALIVFPYFVSGTLALVAIGAALLLVPVFVRL